MPYHCVSWSFFTLYSACKGYFALREIAFRLLTTFFLVYSNKKEGKEMPPLKLMPLRGPLCSSPLAGAKELVA